MLTLRSLIQVLTFITLISLLVTSNVPTAFLFVSSSEAPQLSLHQAADLTRYVDPFIGTGGHGHTFPGATLPFGLVQLSPDTRLTGWDSCSGYHYSDNLIYGFSHTHLSGTGIPDYSDLLFMPMIGLHSFNAKGT